MSKRAQKIKIKNRFMPARRKPFSHKQKKEQLKEKRQANIAKEHDATSREQKKLPSTKAKQDPSHFFLRFINDSDAVVQKNKEAAYVPFNTTGDSFSLDQHVYLLPSCCADIPRRPEGVLKMSKDELLQAETAVFEAFFKGISPDLDVIATEYCVFECNENVYRQVWRVTERSNLMCIVADARFPLAHLPVSILRYAKICVRPVIIVLNKIDLAEKDSVDAWVAFLNKYVGAVLEEVNGQKQFAITTCNSMLLKENKEEHKRFMEAFVSASRALSGISTPKRITVGFFGQPSVGKSSLINGIYGKKVVSVKLTPGHTKHLQTHYLPLSGVVAGETDRSFVLCDCPGLVFAVKGSPRPLQVITGVFPLARTREFLTPLRLLVECVPGFKEDIVERLNLDSLYTRYPELNQKKPDSPGEILELYAYMWSYFSKGLTPNINRAGMELFKLIVNGSIAYTVYPSQDLDKNLNSVLENLPSICPAIYVNAEEAHDESESDTEYEEDTSGVEEL
ncbi:GTP-binding protein [Giardia duodenalis]|uniref:Guanine nucleotide-binding protein-like 1 n=1 Tax=Giardia intestinalis TaxID=5741 RepID=V6TBT7_GIAIN|nr:GTP-binding protein [Giardia intestinalis]